MTHWTVETVQALAKDIRRYVNEGFMSVGGRPWASEAASALTWALERISNLEGERQIYADQAGELAALALEHGTRMEAAEAERDAANARVDAARNEALEEAAEIAEHRADVCSSAATHFNKTEPSEPYWAASERCAERECKHLAIQYRALKTQEASK